MFEGPFSITVDAKGRIAIPSEYREVMMQAAQGRLHVTWHYKESCLLIFPDSTWGPFKAMVEAWPQSVAWQRRMVLNNATGYTLDSSYRILLTSELREFAQIEKGSEARLVGNGSHFELWDKALYMAKVAQERAQPLSDFFSNMPSY